MKNTNIQHKNITLHLIQFGTIVKQHLKSHRPIVLPLTKVTGQMSTGQSSTRQLSTSQLSAGQLVEIGLKRKKSSTSQIVKSFEEILISKITTYSEKVILKCFKHHEQSN